MSVFGKVYAAYYDTLYGEKNYAAECDMVEQLIAAHGGTGRDLLDLGCGSGNHLIPLAARGYRCTGVDLSESMLAAAQAKIRQHGGDDGISLVRADLRQVALGREFDIALMMFAVLGYQRSNTDVLAALSAVRRHLRPGGLFIFDVWYGPAVMALRPSQRVRTIPMPQGKLVRISSGSLDSYHHLCQVDFHLMHIEGDRLLAETEESHTMRYFFPQELDALLTASGLRLETLRAMDECGRAPDETTWNAVGVARAQ